MVRPTLIRINPVELKYYPFIISSNKSTGTCNVSSPKIYVPKETKHSNVKGLNITNENEAKAITEHILCDCKYKFHSTTCNSNQKWSNKTCKSECKNYCACKKDYSRNPSTCIYENSKYLKSISHISVIKCDEIITAMDIISTVKTNTIATLRVLLQ